MKSHETIWWPHSSIAWPAGSESDLIYIPRARRRHLSHMQKFYCSLAQGRRFQSAYLFHVLLRQHDRAKTKSVLPQWWTGIYRLFTCRNFPHKFSNTLNCSIQRCNFVTLPNRRSNVVATVTQRAILDHLSRRPDLTFLPFDMLPLSTTNSER